MVLYTLDGVLREATVQGASIVGKKILTTVHMCRDNLQSQQLLEDEAYME